MQESKESAVVVGVALSGGSKSKAIVNWAIEKFEGSNVLLKLLHVFPRITGVPTPMGNLIPLRKVRDDIASAYQKEVEWQKSEMLLPYMKLCTSKKVSAEMVLVEADDIPTAVSLEVAKMGATDLVIGASSNSMFSRKVKGQLLSSLISDSSPPFCTVYVVSKGKLEALRPSDNSLDDYTSAYTDSAYSSSRYSTTTLGDPGSSSSESSFASHEAGAGVKPLSDTMQHVSHWRSTNLRDAPRMNIPLKKLKEVNQVTKLERELPKPPTHFICPILKGVMDDPCLAADGYTYDRKALEMWLKENDTSPTTNFPLTDKTLILPNHTLHHAIMEWKTKTRTLLGSGTSMRSI